MKKILTDPLCHFILIGAALFLLSAYFDNGSKQEPEKIIVDQDQINRIQAAWEKQWRRKPTNDELARLIDEHVKEEILFREALNLGLDKDDTIIRRRLSQKMKFLIKDIASVNTPDETVLEKYFKENKDRFKIPARASFTHIYVDADKRGAKAAARARDLLAGLKTGDMDSNGLSDPFMLHSEYMGLSPAEVSRLFGRSFAKDVFDVTPGTWQGPVRSGYGIHLVKVTNVTAAAYPAFEQVKDDVMTEYMNEIRLKANKRAVEDLRTRYSIVIDPVSVSLRNGVGS